MKTTKQLIEEWFARWADGRFEALPLADDFTHTSPFGVMKGKKTYMDIVEANRDKFLDKKIVVHNVLAEGNKGCVRYTMHAETFSQEVSEWFWVENDLIKDIISYYNVGEIGEDRKLKEV